MIRVLLDMHALGENLSGNEMYIKYLTKHMLKLRPEKVRLHLAFNNETNLSDFEHFSGHRRGAHFDASCLRTNHSLRRLGWLFPRLLAREAFDIAHFQYVLPFRLPSGTRYVTTIHDTSFKRYPSHYTRRQHVVHHFVDRSVRRAHKVLTISDFSKSELLAHYPFLGDSGITVTHLAADPSVFRRVTDPRPLLTPMEKRLQAPIPSKFILTVGNLQPRKNLERLLAAFSSLSSVHTDLSLVITGRRAWKFAPLMRALRSTPSDRVLFTDYVTDKELVALYNTCTLFVYPSLYEGFGLPVLEAIQCGALALTSRGTALQEICPIEEVLFDPDDVNSLIDVMERVLNAREHAALLKAKQAEIPRRYTWQATATRTLEAYLSLV